MNIDRTEGLKSNTGDQETLRVLQSGDLMTADFWVRVYWLGRWNVVQASNDIQRVCDDNLHGKQPLNACLG